jgi:formylglycine-generating enzyme required for sulfatase activity
MAAVTRPIAVLLLSWSLAAGCRTEPAAAGRSAGGAPPARTDAAAAPEAASHVSPTEAGAPDGPARPGDAAPAGAADAVEAAESAAPDKRGPDEFVLCGQAPPGMVCIPGGSFRRGSDDGPREERPAADVVVSTFLIDRDEVTSAAFHACMEAGACRLMHHYAGFDEPQQPVVAVNWVNAAAYCAWVGKRLPTEAEWEKAARGTDGRTYPWGEDPPSCERAHYRDCAPRSAKPVGSFAPGPWGLHDMAGNAYEFVQDWYSDCYEGCAGACGADCRGPDPRGPCGGGPECRGREKRVLRGGSWFWEADQLRTTNRRGMPPDSGGHRLGFRCAVDAPPPGPVGPPPAAPEPVAPLTDAERTAFHGVPEEELARRPVDNRHWVQSNESGHEAWFAALAGLGGGYVGVGSDQNYTLFAQARSSFVWLMDYDSVVVQANRIYRALVLASASPEEFLLRWDGFEREVTLQLVERAFAGAPDAAELRALLEDGFTEIGAYFVKVRRRTEDGRGVSWLADRELYRYVRRMFQEDRVRIVSGDLLREMPGRIAAAQRALGVPMRVVYLSNAEQYFDYDEAFRTAFQAMPYDERSVILRTVSRPHPDGGHNVWHYQVEPATHFAEALGQGVAGFAALAPLGSYEPSGGLSRLPAP